MILVFGKILGVFLALACASGCDSTEARQKNELYPFTEQGRDLARQLEGLWDIHTISYSTTCPEEQVINPMNGNTRWDTEEHRIEITWLTGGIQSMEFWATSSDTLEVSRSLEILDCRVTGKALMKITELGSEALSGEYREDYHHNQSEVCESASEDFDFPDACEVAVEWRGQRQ